jgi:2-polyprenyl-3-methyl-5-hydroxy-6-metoxy-1,4-benzoquinol methylase
VNPSYGTRPVHSAESASPQSTNPTAGTSSFRDPAGRVILLNDRVLRVMTSQGAQALASFLRTNFATESIADGSLVETKYLAADAELNLPVTAIGAIPDSRSDSVVVEHERIAPRSFPYEWSPRMLHAAGSLILDLASGALDEGFSLKDATPYNVLFKSARPIFVDVLSFELRDRRDPTWLPFNQFVQTILLPLLMNKYFDVRLDQLLLTHREGVEPAAVARLSGFSKKLNPLFLSLVFFPSWLGNKKSANDSIYQPRKLQNAERAKFILERQFKQLRRQLDKLRPVERDSNWSGYMTSDRHFSDDYLQAKQSFVAEELENRKARRVLDVGCNTGHFSRMAAERGAKVVAIDQDPAVVDAVWQSAVSEHLDILPLVVNLARPTPAVGWRNEECSSFLERSRGNFDLVLMLAVLHHLLVSEQIPLPAILELAAELTTKFLIIEFVAPSDPMFRVLVRGRADLYRELTKESFERFASERFSVVRSTGLNDTRSIYLLRKRDATGDV